MQSVKIGSLILFLFVALSCEEKKKLDTTTSTEAGPVIEKNDTYYHYSIWWAFVNKVFDADLSVAELKTKGDTGLGSFNLLDGEMVMIDGIAYRVREDGTISEGADTDKIVYANAGFFENDFNLTLEVKEGMDMEGLKSQLLDKLPSPNFFYMFEIEGLFDYMKCGGLTRQEPPFEEGLDVLIPNRPVFEGNRVSGTIVGFYCPDFIGNINVKGFHFHFISDDKKLGGHVMDFKATENIKVGIDKKTDYHFVLPDNADFENVSLEKEFQYKKNDAATDEQ
ncbi:acetolactate decarboxylase [Maribacter sp. 2307ULW6-5]|uniref:acetolactate decarboxylase n=1 Tax=Maribacter sp. 2307ULW6-5 TaxID=3386275 RepID=UPI0039BD50E1